MRIAALPSFCPLPVGVGIAIAFLVVFLRRKEVRTMKLLGTGRLRAWLSLWLEQLLLCAAGVGLALVGFRLVRGTPPPDGLLWVLLLLIGYLFAAALLATIPVVILFMFIEKHLTAGLTAGGVKG